MDLLQQINHFVANTLLRDLELLTVVPLAAPQLSFLQILLANLEPDGSSLLLPVVELVARVVVISIVAVCPDACIFQLLINFSCLRPDGFHVVSLLHDRYHNNLRLSYSGRQNQAHVVRVNHNHCANTSSREAPRCLPDILLLALLVLVPNIEHLGEVGSQHMRGSALNASSGNWHINFCGCGEVSSSKRFVLTLFTSDNGDGEKLLITLGIELENVHDLPSCILLIGMRGVALLPEEFSGSNERRGVLEFPPHYIGPLVDFER